MDVPALLIGFAAGWACAWTFLADRRRAMIAEGQAILRAMEAEAERLRASEHRRHGR